MTPKHLMRWLDFIAAIWVGVTWPGIALSYFFGDADAAAGLLLLHMTSALWLGSRAIVRHFEWLQ